MPIKPKKIINDPQNAVGEFIDGLLLQYPHQLVKLDQHHVILTANHQTDKVQLLSGGGSGHEPSHAGWIGSGMLDGAVCGGIFASPSVSSILAAVRALSTSHGDTSPDRPTGVLMIVKNYTGDRLNFGMAAERANQQGLLVDMVVVADDCALPRTKGITGARGVAGTVLVHKIAGAAAQQGRTLAEVAQAARWAASRMGTLGIALDSVTVPGAEQINDRLDEHTIEVGLGIHGEAGMRQSPLLTAQQMAQEMITTIQQHGREKSLEVAKGTDLVPLFERGDQVALLVNNLGGTSNFEMSILAKSCVETIEGPEFGAQASHVYVGSYMTSFDMHGVSLTIMNLQGQDQLIQWLEVPTGAPAWKECDVWKSFATATSRPSSIPVPAVAADESMEAALTLPPLEVADFAATAKVLAMAAVTKLAESEPLLTQYDTIVGDGDCGMTMKRGATCILERLQAGTLTTDHPVSMYGACADAISASMGGTSGVLLELMFRKMSSTLSRATEGIQVPQLCQAFLAGVEAVSLYGGAQVGSRTMLDALVPAASALVSSGGQLQEAALAARTGAEGTASMKVAQAGRSNYLSEETLQGTPDPGAVAVALVLEALASAAP